MPKCHSRRMPRLEPSNTQARLAAAPRGDGDAVWREGSSTGSTINAALLASPSAAPRGHSALPYPPGDAQAYNQRLDTLIRDVQTTD